MLHGVPVQVFDLDDGYVVTVAFQGGKTKKHFRYSEFCADTETLGKKVAEYVDKYSKKEEL